MKPVLKIVFCIMMGVSAFATNSKAQGGSTKMRHIIDSLKITDADEIAICTLYDDAVSEYLNALTVNGAKPTAEQSAEISKRFQQRQQQIMPQIDGFRKKIADNYTRTTNFEFFFNYETTRIYGNMLPGNGKSPF